jgi:hypothetical protein
MRYASFRASLAVLIAVAWMSGAAEAVEMKMYDGKRQAVLVEGWKGDGTLDVYLTSGERTTIGLRDIAAIYYSGRPDHFIRTGDQKFIFNAGGHMCGSVEKMEHGDVLTIRSQSLGRHVIPLKHMHGFTAMAIEGRASRLADDLMRDGGVPDSKEHSFLDHVLDRRGVPYAGVVENFTPKELVMEHDEQQQRVPIKTFKLAGVRLAEAAKAKSRDIDPTGVLRVGVRCRDRSYLVGELVKVDPFQWTVHPSWDPEHTIAIPANEITLVDVLGGRAVFLTHLKPAKVEEHTKIAPPQPYQHNANSQGESMDIGGFIYHSGLGVHSHSSLTYKLGGKFKTFKADVGIDGRLEKEGSVVFSVIGDGQELFKSKVVKGKIAGGGLPIEVPVEGVDELTLKVDPTDDLDQGDVANWGAARVLR